MAKQLSDNMSQLSSLLPAVKPTSPPSSIMKFPPSSLPTTLPPPPDHPTLAHPFTIPAHIYNGALSANVPITIALIYASVVTYFNSVNAQRKWKPWAFSETKVFKYLVIVHNIILALYSAWTCVGMVNALRISAVSWRGEHGLAGLADSLCKIHGPRGLGSAAVFSEDNRVWSITNRAFHLAADGLTPEHSDVGRIWNEGLAFYGWLFYLSKFYEVIDTAIILAKGKKSSFLQTYHHAGAMLGMWAGIRYMSPPIWMFVLVNSGIHALMYTFYLCSAVNIKVPKRIKQTLTTMQIAQFVVGASYAFAHLFVAYQIPVSTPYLYHLGDAFSTVASALPTDLSSASSAALATASADVGSWLKKAALRAAGYEGLAENVVNDRGQTFGVDARVAAVDVIRREETRFRNELQWEHCLDTSGQVFAILLNCMYLAPLTGLFVRFFIKAYLRRVERRRSSAASEKAIAARQSLTDASKGLARHVNEVIDEQNDRDDSQGKTDEAAQPKPEPEAEPKEPEAEPQEPEAESKKSESHPSEAPSAAEEASSEPPLEGTDSSKVDANEQIETLPHAGQQSDHTEKPDSTSRHGSEVIDKAEPAAEGKEGEQSFTEKMQRMEEESRRRFAAAQEALEELIDDNGYDKTQQSTSSKSEETSTNDDEPGSERKLEDIEEQSTEDSSEKASEEMSHKAGKSGSQSALPTEEEDDDPTSDEELSFIAPPQGADPSPNDDGTGVAEATGPKEETQMDTTQMTGHEAQSNDAERKLSGTDVDEAVNNQDTSEDSKIEAGKADDAEQPQCPTPDDEVHESATASSQPTESSETSAVSAARTDQASAVQGKGSEGPAKDAAPPKSEHASESEPTHTTEPASSETSLDEPQSSQSETQRMEESEAGTPSNLQSINSPTETESNVKAPKNGHPGAESPVSTARHGDVAQTDADTMEQNLTSDPADDHYQAEASNRETTIPSLDGANDIELSPHAETEESSEPIDAAVQNQEEAVETEGGPSAPEEDTSELNPSTQRVESNTASDHGSQEAEKPDTRQDDSPQDGPNQLDRSTEQQSEQIQQPEKDSEQANDECPPGPEHETKPTEEAESESPSKKSAANEDDSTEIEMEQQHSEENTSGDAKTSEEETSEPTSQASPAGRQAEDDTTETLPVICVPAQRSHTPSIRSKTSSHSMRSSKSQLEQTAEELQAKNGDSPRHSSGSLVPTATA